MKKLLVMCMAMMAMGFAACSEDTESKQIENAVKALVSQYPEATLQDVYKSFYQERLWTWSHDTECGECTKLPDERDGAGF